MLEYRRSHIARNFACNVLDGAPRPKFVSLKNVITAPFILLGLFAGWLAEKAGYTALFWAAAVVAACSALWLAFVVREPRTCLRPATVRIHE